MGTVIKVDGQTEEFSPTNGEAFSLAELQGVVGGHIEVIPLDKGRVMVLNEEGKLDGLPLNPAATLRAYGPIFSGDVIVGDVLIAEPGEMA